MYGLLGIEWHLSLVLVPVVLAAGVPAALALYSWHDREQRGARSFTLLSIGISLWSVTYALHLAASAGAAMFLFNRISFAGSGIVTVAWIVLAVEYAGYEHWLSRRRIAALALVPTAMFVLVWTNEIHGLVWQSVSVDATGPVPVLDLVFGPAYWVNYWYSVTLVLVGIALFATVVVRADRVHRRQSVAVLVGATCPVLANATFHFAPQLNPIDNLDLTTVAFAVTSLCFALALFHYRLLDLVPEARAALVDAVDDGVVVLGPEGRIRSINPTAEQVFDADAVGDPISATRIGGSGGVATGFFTAQIDGETRAFDVQTTMISDFRDEEAGRFVLLRDITRLAVVREQEQRLSVLNRILRHNIRNEMNVIAGRADLLDDDLDDPNSPHVAAIERATDRILDLSDKARYVESALDGIETTQEPIDVGDLITEVLADVWAAHPSADVDWCGPTDVFASGSSDDHVRTILAVLVDNAVVHNPSDEPFARVVVEPTDRHVRVSVVDDGPGIPEIERSILDQERETPLEHGTGLGLWLVNWLAEAADARVSFEENDHGGSTVTVAFARADEPDRTTTGGQ